MQYPFLGEIALVAFNFAPQGWAFCQGQILQIDQYTALFSLLGAQFGGDGQTTFALPDLRGRVPLAFGQGDGLHKYSVGETGGQEGIALTADQMPSHSHAYAPQAIAASGTAVGPAAGNWAQSPDGAALYRTSGPIAKMTPQLIDNAGGGQSHENRQPFLALNYIIAVEGIYPSRI